MGVIAKLAYRTDLGGLGLMQVRFTLSVPLMLLYLAAKDRRLLRPRLSLIAKAALLGGVFYGCQSACFFIALESIPASTAVLILYFYPVLVTFLLLIFFGQRLNWVVALSLLLVLVGCGLIFYDAFQTKVDGRGLILAVGAMVTFSVYLIACQVFLKQEEPLSVAFYVICFAAVTFNLLAGPTRILNWGVSHVMFGGGIALISTVMAISLLYLAIERIGSTYVSIFSTIEPVTTVLGAIVILGENVAAWQLAGMFLIVAGVVLPNLREAARRRETAKSLGRGQSFWL